jgi:hypothetical protein
MNLREDCHDRASHADYSIGVLDRVVGILLREGYHMESRRGPGRSSAGRLDLSLDRSGNHRCSARSGPRQANKVK